MFLLIILPWFIVALSCYLSNTLGLRGFSLLMLLGLFPSILFSWYFLWLILFSDFTVRLVLDLGYIVVLDYCLSISLVMDCWSSIWCVLLTTVSYSIHVYALWYMGGSVSMARFIGTLSLFTGGMSTLLLSGDMLTLFIGWELIGLSSFLLVSHNTSRLEAVRAGLKAVIYNRVGDFGMLLGVCLGLSVYCDTDLLLWCYLDSSLALTSSFRTLLCTLLFLGAWSKSAQFGLHPWLLDAMEGPTPVSALLHSATLVTAGIVLLYKTSAIWLMCPSFCMLLYVLGLVTTLASSFCGVFYMDTKRVVAYSTCTHVGMMLFSLGLSGLSISIDGGSLGPLGFIGCWHMFVHGWAKSLLFLLCGSLLHQLHAQDLRILTGVSVRSVPVYGTFFSLSLLALAGCPGSSISDSKDWILEMGCFSISGYSLFVLMLFIVSLSQGYSLGLVFHLLADMGKFSLITMSWSIFLSLSLLTLHVVYFPLCLADVFNPCGLEPSERLGLFDGFGLYSLLGLLLSLINGKFPFTTFSSTFRSNVIHMVSSRLYLDKMYNSFVLWTSTYIINRLGFDVEYGLLMVFFSPLTSNRVSSGTFIIFNGANYISYVILSIILFNLFCNL
jgi:NADH:ubiquinone oxidoreductase subunit 5 (subunit L)/multisubunit Na+/H+ antiporter MnhA subunit